MNTQDKQKLESICELVQIKKFIPALQFRVLANESPVYAVAE